MAVQRAVPGEDLVPALPASPGAAAHLAVLPRFNRCPIANPVIPIHVTAVNEVICRTSGEVADELPADIVCTRSFID
jgi:hypothetical protein